jgi:hypothetical protein
MAGIADHDFGHSLKKAKVFSFDCAISLKISFPPL